VKLRRDWPRLSAVRDYSGIYPRLPVCYGFVVNSKSTDARLKHDLRRLVRSLDFVSRHPALKRDTVEAQWLAQIAGR